MGSALRSSASKLAAAFVFAALLTTSAARAAGENALDLSKQGYELFLANKCDEAIPILKRSIALEPNPRTFVNLARCEDKVGTLVAALGHLNEARDRARRDNSDAMVTQLDTMIADMEKRIPHVELKLDPQAPPGTTIKLGATTVEPGTIAVDPGPQSFVVSARDRSDATMTITLAAGETRSLLAAPGAPLVATPPVTAPPPEAAKSSPLRTAGVVGMIAGGAGLVVGGIFGAIALGKKGDAEDAGCNGSVCANREAGALRDDAKSAGTISTIAFVAGGVLAAGGLGMFILAPNASSDRVGLTLSGRF